MSVGSTSARSVQVLGFDDIGRLTPCRRLYPLRVPRTSALLTTSSRFPVARDTLVVQLTLPLVGRVEDFHLQVCAPCRAHQREEARFEGEPLFMQRLFSGHETRIICEAGDLLWPLNPGAEVFLLRLRVPPLFPCRRRAHTPEIFHPRSVPAPVDI